MPTFDWDDRFIAESRNLSAADQALFLSRIPQLVEYLRTGSVRRGLRLKGVRGHPGVFEITWAPDGRATFSYGQTVRRGEPHVTWRRIGGHDILRDS